MIITKRNKLHFKVPSQMVFQKRKPILVISGLCVSSYPLGVSWDIYFCIKNSTEIFALEKLLSMHLVLSPIATVTDIIC